MLGISQCCDQWRSQKLPEVISKSEVGIPEHPGKYVHSGLHRKKSVAFVVDNTDDQVDTP